MTLTIFPEFLELAFQKNANFVNFVNFLKLWQIDRSRVPRNGQAAPKSRAAATRFTGLSAFDSDWQARSSGSVLRNGLAHSSRQGCPISGKLRPGTVGVHTAGRIHERSAQRIRLIQRLWPCELDFPRPWPWDSTTLRASGVGDCPSLHCHLT